MPKTRFHFEGALFQPSTFGYIERPSGGHRALADLWDISVNYNLDHGIGLNLSRFGDSAGASPGTWLSWGNRPLKLLMEYRNSETGPLGRLVNVVKLKG
jgi:hypothetical protein